MANKRISDLAAAAALDGTEQIELEQSGGGVEESLSVVKTFINNNPAARAKTLAASSVTSGDPFKFLTEDYDVSSNYSPSTGKFTATVAGVYQVNARIFPNTGANIYIKVNGTAVSRGSLGSASEVMIVSDCIYLAVNDEVTITSDVTFTPGSETSVELHNISVSYIGHKP